MSKYQTLTIEQTQHIATIRLNRPDAANCLNVQMSTDLLDVARYCDSTTDIRVVVLTGNGAFFCAGGDVKYMHEHSAAVGNSIKQIADQLHAAISMFARMSAPLIVAVNGTAAGAGFSMALSGDLVITAQSAKFTSAYSGVGLSPDGSATYYLPRLIGLRKAQEILFTNPTLSADDCLAMGLINEIVADQELATRAQELAQQLANNSPESNAAIKQLLLCSADNSLETQLELEGRAIAQCASSDNGKEGIAAFVEKRRPIFN